MNFYRRLLWKFIATNFKNKEGTTILTENIIVLLAGGLTAEGKLPEWVHLRILKGIEIAKSVTNPTVIFSSNYTLNKPPILQDGFPKSEAVEMARVFQRYADFKYCPLIENSSHDTIGSAFYVRSLLLNNDEKRDLLLVTSDFHMDRAAYIYQKVLSLEPPFNRVSLIPAATISNTQLLERRDKEKKAGEKVKKTLDGFNTVQQFRDWLFCEHSNYNVEFCSRNIATAEAY